MESNMKEPPDEAVAEQSADQVVAQQIASDLHERGLISEQELERFVEGLSTGDLSSEEWVRIAERGIDRKIEGEEA
jgi:hypothetical protein